MKLELGPVDIPKAIEAAAEGIQDRLATDRIRLKIDIDANIGSFIGDERRVVQVLYNLLANAVGFSPQDAIVGISAQRTDHSVVFAVSDSGPGIAPDLKDKVFDWFESQSQGSRRRGPGLGLSLVEILLCSCMAARVPRRYRRIGNGTTSHLRFRSTRPCATQRNDSAHDILEVALANEAATAHLMADLAPDRPGPTSSRISGDLGAGKTAAAPR